MSNQDQKIYNDIREVSIKELVIKIRSFFRYLLTKWILILIFGFLGAALGLAYSFFKKPIYTAITTFVLENGDNAGGGLGQYAGLASVVGIDIGGGGGGLFQGDNILELYRSRTMIEKTLLTEVKYKGENQLLVEHYIQFKKLRNTWISSNDLRNFKFKTTFKSESSRLQDSILGTIVIDINKNYLSVTKPDKKLSIIKVVVNAEDEFFAKTFNDLIVRKVNEFYVQTKTKKSLQNVSILNQKVDSVRATMNGAIYSAAAIADETPNLNQSRQSQRVAPIQRSQFTAETNKVILSELLKNLEMSKIALLKETPLIQVVDQPVYPLYKLKLGKLKGLFLGGFLGGFLIILFLSFRKIFRKIMA